MKIPIRKAITVIFAVNMIATLAACSSQPTQSTTDSKSSTISQTATVPDTSEKHYSYTSSGYKPLDDIIFPILDEIITRDMTESDKCLAVYDYLLKYDYIERTLLIPESEKEYTEQLYAISLFENKYGVCYDFSAAFKFMTRAVGVDTLMYYGQHSSNHSPSGYIPHSWDVIERDGVPYIYDISMEKITMDAGRENSYHCRYGITYEGFPGYYYIPETFTR
ncbi:MAG: transglutaminase domain-containing protein [Ruminiclostridium sp.]